MCFAQALTASAETKVSSSPEAGRLCFVFTFKMF